MTSKDDIRAAVRQCLVGTAAWLNLVFDADAGKRLLGDLSEGEAAVLNDWPDGPPLYDWSEPRLFGDIDSTLAMRLLTRIHRFHTTGVWDGHENDLLDRLHEVSSLIEVWRHGMPTPIGMPMLPPDALALIEQSITGASLRWRLSEGESLDLPELAALAGVSESTVRKAAIGQEGDAELKTTKDGRNTFVTAEQANRWLATRRDWCPTVFGSETITTAPQSFFEVGDVMKRLLARESTTLEAVLDKLPAWSDEQRKEAHKILEGDEDDVSTGLLTAYDFLQLAKALGHDEPARFAAMAATWTEHVGHWRAVDPEIHGHAEEV